MSTPTQLERVLVVEKIISLAPDLVIASLSLPGLSGKDLLVALRSQGMDVPTLVTAREGMDADAIQAFRLGATDYLVKPLREAEVVAAVERAIYEVRLRRDREQLAKQLAESNRQLERRVRELTTLSGIGKTVTSTTHQGQLFDKLMEGSLYVADADMGWVLLPDEDDPQLYLRAQRNLPSDLAGRMHQPWDDGVSSLVMLSGEALAIHGDGLSQFKLGNFGEAALIAPIKVRDQSIGIIAVARKKLRPFSERAQAMLEAVADYASISLVNARLFQALEARAHRLQQMIDEAHTEAKERAEWRAGLSRGLRAGQAQIARLLDEVETGPLRSGLETVYDDLEALLKDVASVSDLDTGDFESLPESTTH